MDKDTGTMVPFAAYEAENERKQKIIKWLIIILVVQFILFTASWAGFLWYESQFETVESCTTDIEAQQDGSGINIVGGGDVEYGAENPHSEDLHP